MLRIYEHDARDCTFNKIEGTNGRFYEFSIYDYEWYSPPHFHVKIYKKDKYSNGLDEEYNVSIRLDKAEFYHKEDLGVLPSKGIDEVYYDLITILSREFNNEDFTLYEFLCTLWYSAHNKSCKFGDIPDYNLLKQDKIYYSGCPINIFNFVVFADSFIFIEPNEKPHIHVRIYKRNYSDYIDLYHLSIRLDKPKFYHIKEMDMINDIRVLKTLGIKINYDMENLIKEWNKIPGNKKCKLRKKPYNYYDKLVSD